MSVSLKKIDGVESATVTLEDSIAKITLKAGNSVRLQQIRDAVKGSGFTPRDAVVTALGELIALEPTLELQITGVNETFQVDGSAANKDAVRQHVQPGKTVQVEGIIVVPGDKRTPSSIRITSVKPCADRICAPQ